LELYPNPAIDHLVLNASTPIFESFKVKVFNIKINWVYTRTIQKLDQLFIPTFSWKSGSYILKIQGDSEISIAKFIVQ